MHVFQVPGTGTDHETPTYRHPLAATGFPLSIRPGSHSCYDWLLSSFHLHPSLPCTGTRERLLDGSLGDFRFHSYGEVDEITRDLASGMRVLSLQSQASIPFIAIWSRNREEWVWVDLACVRQTITVIPIFDSASDLSIKHIFNQTQVNTVFCGPERTLQIVKLKESCVDLRIIVQFEPVSEQLKALCAAVGLTIIPFQDVLKVGRDRPVPDNPPNNSDYYAFSYTSGTTGLPKGVMTTYFNLEAAVTSIFLSGTLMQPGTKHLSYMPLAHLFERINLHLVIKSAAAIGFFSGDVSRIVEDAKLLGPTVFPTVPRIVKRLVGEIQADMRNLPLIWRVGIWLFLWWKGKCMDWFDTCYSCLDAIFLAKYREMLGPNLKEIVCSSAPIDSQTLDFLSLVLSVSIKQPYGQTETSGPTTASQSHGRNTNTVGYPYPCMEYKLISIPDMTYFVTDKDSTGVVTPRGEILVRGPGVCAGYYKLPEETMETIDSEGWVHTGDVGLITPDTRLKIIDRKKHFFKLAQGEFIAPEKIQNVLLDHELILQIYVTGDSMRDFLVAILYPSYPLLTPKFPGKTVKELSKSREVERYIAAVIREYGLERGLNSLEIPKRFYLKSKAMKPNSGIFTPSMKLIRTEAKRKYEGKIAQLYSF